MKRLACVVVFLLGPLAGAAAAADEGRRGEPPVVSAYEVPSAGQRSAVEAPVSANVNEPGTYGVSDASADPARDRKAAGVVGDRRDPAQQEPLFLLLLQILRTPK